MPFFKVFVLAYPCGSRTLAACTTCHACSAVADLYCSAGYGACDFIMVCIAHTSIHSHLHSVLGCANIGASAQEQLQPGMHCATLLGWPHLLCDRCLHHPDRYPPLLYVICPGYAQKLLRMRLPTTAICGLLRLCPNIVANVLLATSCTSVLAAQCLWCCCIHLLMAFAGASNKQWEAMKDAKTIWIGVVAGVGAGLLCLCTVIPYLRWKIPKEMEMQRR